MTTQSARWSWIATAVAVAAALVSIGSAVYTVLADRRDDSYARAQEARAARHDVIANVLQMGQYDAEGGAGNQHEILVLAGDAVQLIDDFTQDRLHLTPVVYRQLAEYVTYSTRDAELAERLAEDVIEVSAEGSTEIVFAHRVLGDLAAQKLDPGLLEEEYQSAIDLNHDFKVREPQLGKEVQQFTEAHRLLSALLGASLSRELPTVYERFCEQADRWQSARTLVEQFRANDRIVGQLRRLDAKNDLDQLDAVCP